MNVRIDTIISGGQSGVDRAALDVAIKLGIACGGWCPKGRWAEDGPIPDVYPMRETPSVEVAQRTGWNVRDSDGTLVITEGPPAAGTALTIDMTAVFEKPCLVVDVAGQGDQLSEQNIGAIAAWISEHRIRLLNVAGQRESTVPGIYQKAAALLLRLLSVG
jgi:hypothetical protein